VYAIHITPEFVCMNNSFDLRELSPHSVWMCFLRGLDASGDDWLLLVVYIRRHDGKLREEQATLYVASISAP
jgi:hypothetical protein